MRYVLILSYLLVQLNAIAQSNYTGRVFDRNTNEPLIGVFIQDTISKIGTTTNDFGYYNIVLDQSKSVLSFQYLGYDTYLLPKDSLIKKSHTIYLLPKENEIAEVVVKAEKIPTIAKLDKLSLTAATLVQHQIVVLGERDILKTLQLFPGIAQANEGNSTLLVRGGSADQNLFLIDNIEIINPFHIGGLLSTFDPDIIKKVDVYKGSFPARFGTKASSIVDIRLNDGRNDKWSKKMQLGTITSKFYAEGPLSKKTTMFFNLRRSTIDLLYKGLAKLQSSPFSTSFGIYDFNSKIIYKVSPKHELAINYYLGNDKLTFNNQFETTSSNIKSNYNTKWGNKAIAISQNLIKDKVSIKNLFSISSYSNDIRSKESVVFKNSKSDETTFNLLSNIINYTLKSDHQYYLNSTEKLNYGLNYTYQHFSPRTDYSEIFRGEVLIDTTIISRLLNNHLTNAYIEYERNLNSTLQLKIGSNLALFYLPNKDYSQLNLQPRISINQELKNNTSLNVGYARTNQYTHLLSPAGAGLPLESWVPASDIAVPITSDIVSLGYNTPALLGHQFNIEAYYKSQSNLINYKESSSFFNRTINFEKNIALNGISKIYGMEVLIEKKRPKYNYIVSYTLSKIDQQFDEINNGAWHPSRFDRRHNFSSTFYWKLSKKVDFSTVWVYNSGARFTAITGLYNAVDYVDKDKGVVFYQGELYSGLNQYKAPAYHRLDINFKIKRFKGKKDYSEWLLGVYNAYNRINPYLIFAQKEGDNLQYKKFGLFPALPSISYTRYF
jgi:hypothetical protein